MATYKVLQDIEAEDKLIGPLTLRQCIYAAIAVLSGYLTFLVASKGSPYASIVFLPFVAFGLFFAWPWSKQQSTEVWALAKIRFALKPHRRIWDQSGVKNLVTVTAPKQMEKHLVRDISETEVRSRLQALADTIDSRGWAIKNVPLGLYTQPYSFAPQESDRLVDGSSMPREVPNYTTTYSDDIFDLDNNPVAQQFDAKITAATSAHRQQLMSNLAHPQQSQAAQGSQAVQQAADPAATQQTQNYWYLPQQAQATQAPAFSDNTMPFDPMAGTPQDSSAWQPPQAAMPTPEEEALAQEIKRKQELLESQPSATHIRTIQPLSVQEAQARAQAEALAAQAAAAPVTAPPNPAILELANNNDLDVATIAREAHHRNSGTSDEVVVSLH